MSHRTRTVTAFAAVTILVAAVLIIFIPSELDRTYDRSIEDHRREIDAFMRHSPESPIPPGAISELAYFAPDREYRVDALIEPIDGTPLFSVPMTGGTEELYERYAWAMFTFRDVEYRLLLLRSPAAQPDNRVLLAFVDGTSGRETYPGGRYINLFLDTDRATIDFNRAYNPYCVYDPSYVCPVPPLENRLGVRIEAGELMWPGRNE